MTVTRRHFCASLGALAATAATGPTPALAATPGLTEPLRLISYNVLKCTGWPADRPLAVTAVGNQQMARRMALELALYDPHIINFSESPSEATTKQIAEYLGMHHVRFPSGGAWPGTILSKYPIVASENVPLGRERPEELFTRHWGRAVIELPGGKELIVHSAHLYPHAEPARRLQEIPAMLESMTDDLHAGRSMILMGDLNHRPDTQEHRMWLAAGWTDTFVSVGKGDGATIPADRPRSRIDYILAAGPIAETVAESRPLFEGAFRTNPDDSQGFALSDHLPQYAVFIPPAT